MSTTIRSGLVVGVSVTEADFYNEVDAGFRCERCQKQQENTNHLYCPACGGKLCTYRIKRPNLRFAELASYFDLDTDPLCQAPDEGYLCVRNCVAVQTPAPMAPALVMGVLLRYISPWNSQNNLPRPVDDDELTVAKLTVRQAMDIMKLTGEIRLYPFLRVS